MTDKPDKIETRGRKRVNRARVDMSVDMDVAVFLKSLRNKQGAFISDKVKRSKEFKAFQLQDGG